MTLLQTARKFMYSMQVGLTTGYNAARRVFDDPVSDRQRSFMDISNAYALLWSYYNSSLFDRGSSAFGVWSAYKAAYTLYHNIRMIYNPTRRLVDFYAGAIYPGVLTTDAEDLPDGVPCAIPFDEDMDEQLKEAIGQYWIWSNWQAKKSVEVRYGAALGSVLVEVVDDVDRGKVTTDIVWPGFVSDLDVDSAGNVKAYSLTYQAQDDDGYFMFRKDVTPNDFRFYRNDQPFTNSDHRAVEPNPYGFVPAVWIKHSDTGSLIGSPAIAASLGKIDELNNLMSHTHDQVHKVIGAPAVLWSSGGVRSLFETQKRSTTEITSEETVRQADQEGLLLLKGPADGRVDSLAGNLPLADVVLMGDKLLAEIEADHPELTYWQQLREMSQVTGPAAARLVGDVAARVGEAAANYDQQNIKLFQMAVAIGGYRANSGAWRNMSPKQQKFLPFNLDSYQRGDLDFEILPRPLLKSTNLEKSMELQAFWTAVKTAHDATVPVETALRSMGWADEQIDQYLDDKTKQIKRDQMLSLQDTVPPVDQQGNPTQGQSSQGGKPAQSPVTTPPPSLAGGR